MVHPAGPGRGSGPARAAGSRPDPVPAGPFTPSLRAGPPVRISGLAPGAGALLPVAGVAESGEELIRAMAAGDREALGRFYDRYAPLVHPLLLRLVGDPAEAADVLQEVFWEAWRAAAGYDPARGTPEAWIVVRARSRGIDRRRALRRKDEVFVAPVDERLAVAAGPAGDAADRATLDRALGALPEEQRAVIELAYFGGLSQTEIAERLEQPLGTVKTRLRLGLERLRRSLTERP